MSAYVDDMRRRAQLGRFPANWSHLFADTPEELREWASKLGLKTAWLQHAGTHREHYDVTDEVRKAAFVLGAIPITYPRQTGDLMNRRRLEQASIEEPMSCPYCRGTVCTCRDIYWPVRVGQLARRRSPCE